MESWAIVIVVAMLACCLALSAAICDWERILVALHIRAVPFMLEAKGFPGYYVCATPDGLALRPYDNTVSFERAAVWRKAAPIGSGTPAARRRLELVSERGSFVGRQRHDELSITWAPTAMAYDASNENDAKDLEVVFVQGLVEGRHTVSLELPVDSPMSYVVATTSTSGEPAGLAVRPVASSDEEARRERDFATSASFEVVAPWARRAKLSASAKASMVYEIGPAAGDAAPLPPGEGKPIRKATKVAV